MFHKDGINDESRRHSAESDVHQHHVWLRSRLGKLDHLWMNSSRFFCVEQSSDRWVQMLLFISQVCILGMRLTDLAHQRSRPLEVLRDMKRTNGCWCCCCSCASWSSSSSSSSYPMLVMEQKGKEQTTSCIGKRCSPGISKVFYSERDREREMKIDWECRSSSLVSSLFAVRSVDQTIDGSFRIAFFSVELDWHWLGRLTRVRSRAENHQRAKEGNNRENILFFLLSCTTGCRRKHPIIRLAS